MLGKISADKRLTKRKVMFDTAHELYNKLLSIYKTQYDKPTKAQRKKIKVQNVPVNIPINLYLDEDDLLTMPPLEGDEEEVEEEKGLKVLPPNKLLTRLPILSAQIKATSNSRKLKNKIRQILYFLYQHNKITEKVYNNLIKSL